MMLTLEKALTVCAPYDIVQFEIEIQSIVKKSDLENLVPSSLLAGKAESFVTVGSMPERNPTYWNATEGVKKELVDDWKDRLSTALALERKFIVNHQELDNNSLVTTVASTISMLLVNCKDLPKEQIKEAKCATVFTAFGPLALMI